MIRGSVDVVTQTEVRGWAFSVDRNEPVQIQVLLNQEILGETQASLHRPDLAAAGLGDGNSGFAVKLYRSIDPLYLPFLVVKVDGGDVELPRAPMLGFKEFFSSLHFAHPAAGRHRSVFGGLWTSRTDALSLLRGKFAIGQVGAEAASAAQDLIQSGVAMIHLPELPNRSDWRGAFSKELAELLECPALLSPLRTILEDNPLVVTTEWVDDLVTELAQPSCAAPTPSPTECLEIIVPFSDGVVLEVVRDSHELPEFTANGKSRWTACETQEVADLVGVTGMLDRDELVPGTVAIIGPGTIYRLRCEFGSAAARAMCLPARGRSVAVALDTTRQEEVRESGVAVFA